MFGDLQLQYIGWACTLLGGFLCGLLTFWLLRPKPKRMPELPKPTPYASAAGSRPPAPWDELERRVTKLEAFVAQDRQDWQYEVAKLGMAVTAHEPLAPGVRVWRDIENGFLYVVPPNGTDWALVHADWFEAKAAWTAAQFERHALFYTELHGHERDSVVRDWMNRGNV